MTASDGTTPYHGLNGVACHGTVANVGEKGREGMDSVLKKKMNITDEQAMVDATKIKQGR